jgi:Rrf2 family iron-sulfur cluster assembly transcriptional regulator
MRLSTRSRYGTRLMLDMAQRYEEGPIQLGEIAKRQHISVKYLEQIIIPLKKAAYVKSVRGAKGGHMLAKSPKEISVGEIVSLLEGDPKLTDCAQNPHACDRSESCLTRIVWREAGNAMFERLNSITLYDLMKMGEAQRKEEGI